MEKKERKRNKWGGGDAMTATRATSTQMERGEDWSEWETSERETSERETSEWETSEG